MKEMTVRCLLCALGVALGVLAAEEAVAQGALVGFVTSQNNVRLDGVTVTLEGVGSTTTDSQGRFEFTGVSQGSYRLTTAKDGFLPLAQSVYVRGGLVNTIQLTLAGIASLPPTSRRAVLIPIRRQGSAILVRGTLNKRREALFVVDTGATYTVISWQMATDLGMYVSSAAPSVTLTTASGVVQAPLVTVESLAIESLEARDVAVVIHDLPRLPPSVGLLGLSFLNRFRVQINAEEGYMRIEE